MGCVAPKPPPMLQVGVQDAPSALALASLPADCHVDLCHGGVLLLPCRQQVVQMGHQHVEERHHEGQDQQDGFLLPLTTAPCSVVLLNLVSGYQGECVAASSLVPSGRAANASARRGAATGLPLPPRAAPASLPSSPAPAPQHQGIRSHSKGRHSPRACALRSSAQPVRSPALCSVRGPRPGEAQQSAPGAGRVSGSGSGTAGPRAAPGRKQCQCC